MTRGVATTKRSSAGGYCRRHDVERGPSNAHLGTEVLGCSPNLSLMAHGPHRLAVDFVVGRYYDPETGQFLSVDPAVQQTLNAYLYAGDDPVNAGDPLGLTPSCQWLNQETDARTRTLNALS